MQSMCVAQHLRIYACAIANDSAGASMGGSSNGSGLYQSDDTGKTWKHLGWDNIKCYSMDMVQSSNGRILYEATGLGILRSVDGGEHWKQITDWHISEAMDVAVNQKNPNEIHVATAHGPWRTTNGGESWRIYKERMHLYFEDSSFDSFYSGFVDRVYLDQGTLKKPSWHVWDGYKVDPFVTANVNGLQGYKLIQSSLDEGVLVSLFLDQKFVKKESTLPRRQIWTLKTFLVTP